MIFLAVLPPPLIALSVPVSREMEKIYDLVPRTDDVFNLSRSELELHDELGTGNFGSVLRGTYKHKGMAIPVAVKTLKKDDLPTAEVCWCTVIIIVSNFNFAYYKMNTLHLAMVKIAVKH